MNAIALKLPNGEPSPVGVCENCGWVGEMRHAERCCKCGTCGGVMPKTKDGSWCGEHDTCRIRRERAVVKAAFDKITAMSDNDYFCHYSAQDLAGQCERFLGTVENDFCEKKIRH